MWKGEMNKMRLFTVSVRSEVQITRMFGVRNILLNILITLIATFFIKFLWKNRWLYYYGMKIPGPFNLQPLGNVSFLKILFSGDIKSLGNMFNTYRPVGRFWIGPELFIFTTEPSYVETILTDSLQKSQINSLVDPLINESVLSSEIKKWKKNRKIMNPSFNKQIIKSFHEIFVKYSDQLVELLSERCGTEQTDFAWQIWRNNMDMANDTLTDVDPGLIKNRDQSLQAFLRLQEIFMERFENFLLLFNTYNLVSESKCLIQSARALSEKVISLFKESRRKAEGVDRSKSKRLLSDLMKVCEETNAITDDEILEEIIFMLLAASETTALGVTFVLMILGMNPEIQEKVHQEIISALGSPETSPDLKDMTKMPCLERVIKETLRLFPPAPVILRKSDQDLHFDSYVFPAGSHLVIPIAALHKDAKIWPDPEKFDPDRFLPEEVEKRHKCSYIPFSYGPRNCIGRDYGIMSMKVVLSMVLQRFRVKTTNYKSLEEIELTYAFLIKPKNCRLLFEKRTY